MTDQPAAAELWMDWITIWQSEMAALAMDREAHESIRRAVDFSAANAATLVPDSSDDPARRTGPAVPPWPAPAGDAAVRDAAIRELAGRVAELERRLGPAF